MMLGDFRGYDKLNRRWVFGDKYRYHDKIYIIPQDVERVNFLEIFDAIEIGTQTIGIYTGMNDKLGIKIYTDDIVSGVSANPFSEGDIREYTIFWGIDSFWIRGTNFSLQELFNYCQNDICVVGNSFKL